jgi:DNA-binding MurR/RpiR family transcriptional regulator
MTGCLLKLREILDDLKPSEMKVAKYILNNMDSIVGMPIGELAEKSNVSKAAVVRLSKTLGFSGYRDFAIEIAGDMASQKADTNEYTDIQPGDKLETIIKNVCLNNRKAIEDTLQILDHNEVKKAVQAIHRARRIVFFGVGASGIVAMDAAQKFLRIGKFCQYFIDPHLQITAAANLSKGDVAVAISYSGETRDILESARVAAQSGAVILAVTKYGRSALSEMADIRLFLSSPETTMRSGAMASRIAQLNMIDIVFSGVASMEYPQIKKHLDRTYKVTHSKKNSK